MGWRKARPSRKNVHPPDRIGLRPDEIQVRSKALLVQGLLLALGLLLVPEPVSAQSNFIERARQSLGNLVDRLVPAPPPRRRRAAGGRATVKAPPPQPKPDRVDAVSLVEIPEPEARAGPSPALRLQSTVFEPSRPKGTPPPPGRTITLAPTGLTDMDVLVRSVVPVKSTAFLKPGIVAPLPVAKPSPPPEHSPDRNIRLTALPPQKSGVCGGSPAILAVYEAKPAIRNGSCRVPQPVLLRAVGGGGLKISPSATANCQLTAALSKWAETVVAPAARRHLGVAVVSVRNMASYACRRRNNSRSGRISEHAFANALDVGTFNLADGGQVSVLKDWRGGGGKQAFLREVHARSCGVFKTVLGPNSDRYHASHFHLDLAKRRSTYCR